MVPLVGSRNRFRRKSGLLAEIVRNLQNFEICCTLCEKKLTFGSNNQYKLKKWFVLDIFEGVLSKMWPLRTGSGQSGSGNPKTFRQYFTPIWKNKIIARCYSIPWISTLYDYQNMNRWPSRTCSGWSGSGNLWHDMTFLLSLLKMF